jgi:prepilin-type N-terminal cleavage/methylation domain-containing protein
MSRKSEAGFTLIEVLAAFSILSLVIITGFRIFSSGLNLINTAESGNEQLAQANAMLLQVYLSQDAGILPPTRTKLRVVKSIVGGGSVEWTNAKPVLIQIRDGDKIVLETIILTRDNTQ